MTPVFFILLTYMVLTVEMGYYIFKLSRISIQVGSDLTVLRMWICDGVEDEAQLQEAIRYSEIINEPIKYLRNNYVLSKCPNLNGRGFLIGWVTA